jgi:hypothetical protein
MLKLILVIIVTASLHSTPGPSNYSENNTSINMTTDTGHQFTKLSETYIKLT